MEFFQALQCWHWLIISFLCLGFESLGLAGFLLGSAVAGFLIAILIWMLPNISLAWQLTWFSLLSLFFTIAYWIFFRKFNEKSDHSQLNQRASQLVGRVIILGEDVPLGGQGKVQVGDTFWKIKAATTLEQGTTVIIRSYDNMTLLIEENQ